MTALDHEALARNLTIDITTIGRRTGQPARIEIWWFRFEDRFIIAGTPGPRDWLANVQANPAMQVHVDGLDIAATAVEVTDEAFRRRFFSAPATSWYSSQSGLDRLVAAAPMIELTLVEPD
jgi:deazaflavin-dependent oxidoreductase (nitroreductase family)